MDFNTSTETMKIITLLFEKINELDAIAFDVSSGRIKMFPDTLSFVEYVPTDYITNLPHNPPYGSVIMYQRFGVLGDFICIPPIYPDDVDFS